MLIAKVTYVIAQSIPPILEQFDWFPTCKELYFRRNFQIIFFLMTTSEKLTLYSWIICKQKTRKLSKKSLILIFLSYSHYEHYWIQQKKFGESENNILKAGINWRQELDCRSLSKLTKVINGHWQMFAKHFKHEHMGRCEVLCVCRVASCKLCCFQHNRSYLFGHLSWFRPLPG